VSEKRIFESGLQPERTLLAWRRTCLVLALGVAVSIRFGAIADPLVAILVGVPALALVGAAYALTSIRYSRAIRALVNDPTAAISEGRAIAAVALVALFIGLAALGFVVSRSEVLSRWI
jgi:putative membrane protein